MVARRNNPLVWKPAKVTTSTSKAEAKTSKAAGAAAQARTAPAAPAKPKDTRYVVKRGDNLSTIAAKHNTTLAKVLKLNPSLRKDPDKIFRGTKVRLK
jgi:LysM repeat protein